MTLDIIDFYITFRWLIKCPIPNVYCSFAFWCIYVSKCRRPIPEFLSYFNYITFIFSLFVYAQFEEEDKLMKGILQLDPLSFPPSIVSEKNKWGGKGKRTFVISFQPSLFVLLIYIFWTGVKIKQSRRNVHNIMRKS